MLKISKMTKEISVETSESGFTTGFFYRCRKGKHPFVLNRYYLVDRIDSRGFPVFRESEYGKMSFEDDFRKDASCLIFDVDDCRNENRERVSISHDEHGLVVKKLPEPTKIDRESMISIEYKIHNRRNNWKIKLALWLISKV